MEWKIIGGFIWDKLFGSSTRLKEFAQISREWKGLYEEKKKLVAQYEQQLKVIESFRAKHPDNGVDLDKWKEREYVLMMELVKAHEMINFYRERSIFLEHEIDLLFNKIEKGK